MAPLAGATPAQAGTRARNHPGRYREAPAPRDIHHSLLAVAIMGITSAAAWGLSYWLPPAALPLLFVLGVLATALTTSLVPATLAASKRAPRKSR